MDYLTKSVKILARQDSLVANLAMSDQLDILEDRLVTAIAAIQTLHDKKLSVDFLTNDQLTVLFTAVNQTAVDSSYTLLPTLISDLF